MKNLIEHLSKNRSKKLQNYFWSNAQRIKRYSLLVNELMKKKALVLYILTISFNYNQIFANEVVYDTLRTQVFSLSPISKKVDQVNGMVLGVGIWEDDRPIKINGLNIEVHPLAVFGLLMMPLEKIESPNSSNIKVNGVNISGGIFDNYHIKGLSISALSICHQTDGFSTVLTYNILENANGINIAGLYNKIENGNGLFISPVYNKIEVLKGLSIGTINYTITNKGLQIGLVNINKSEKGLQIGLWNINAKRTLPFINW